MKKNRSFRRRILILLSIAAAVTGVLAAIMIKLFRDTFMRRDPKPGDEESLKDKPALLRFHAKNREALPELNDLPADQIEITSADDLTLRGKLFHVKDYNKKVVIAFHGYHSGGARDMAHFVHMYRSQGYDFLLVSQRAHENSEGRYITFGVKEHQDGIRWVRKIIDVYGDDVQIVLHGVSMGAATALMMAGASTLPPNVKCCVADSSYDTFENVARPVLKAGFKNDQIVALILKLTNVITMLLDDFCLSDASPIDSVRRSFVPVLFIHGTADGLIPCSLGQRLYDECASPKEQYLAEGSDHLCSSTDFPEEYERRFEEFCRQYI